MVLICQLPQGYILVLAKKQKKKKTMRIKTTKKEYPLSTNYNIQCELKNNNNNNK